MKRTSFEEANDLECAPETWTLSEFYAHTKTRVEVLKRGPTTTFAECPFCGEPLPLKGTARGRPRRNCGEPECMAAFWRAYRREFPQKQSRRLRSEARSVNQSAERSAERSA